MWIILALALSGTEPSQPPSETRVIGVSEPASVVTMNKGDIKGLPWRMAWSPEATELYLQSWDGRGPDAKPHHYVISLAEKTSKSTREPPAWADEYWKWKAAQSAPRVPAFAITLDEHTEIIDPLNQPRHAMYLSDSISGQNQLIAKQAGSAHIYRMLLKGQVVGEWVDEPPAPGLTYSWAPAGLPLIAFVNKKGQIVFMDLHGRTQELEASKNAVLPAWSDGGGTLAYLERRGKSWVVNLVDLEPYETTK